MHFKLKLNGERNEFRLIEKFMTEKKTLDAYLKILAERIRGMRARRGISRKTLSELTGISERYLANVEGASANPSIEVLWGIAEALDLTISELVVDSTNTASSNIELTELLKSIPAEKHKLVYSMLMQYFSGSHKNLSGVVLLGIRGAGKTTLGENLSQEFNIPFVRLRDIIEKIAGADLATIFAVGGQRAYRQFESQAVEHVKSHHPGALIEAGGSIVSTLTTFNSLRASFFTVWVNTSLQAYIDRVIGQGELRILQSTDEVVDDLKRILSEREPYYRLANYSIDTTDRSVVSCVTELKKVCAPYLTKHVVENSKPLELEQ